MPYYSKCYIWEGWLVMTKLDFDDYLFPLEDKLCIKIKGNILILKINCYWFKWLIIDNWKTCLRFQGRSSRTAFLKSNFPIGSKWVFVKKTTTQLHNQAIFK